MKSYKLTVAPNGARLNKADHKMLPLTISEIVQTAKNCFKAGAHEIHLHIREKGGSHSINADIYREYIQAVKATVPTMTIQITTESAGIFKVSEQLECLDKLRPKAASIAIREMAREPELAQRAYAICAESNTKVQHILYTPDCVSQLVKWRKDKTVKSQQNDIIFVLGHYNPPVLATPDHLDIFLKAIEGHDYKWSACAFGKDEHACLLRALQLGGNVRIGFENNIQNLDGTYFINNAESVAGFIATAAENGFHPMKTDQ